MTEPKLSPLSRYIMCMGVAAVLGVCPALMIAGGINGDLTDSIEVTWRFALAVILVVITGVFVDAVFMPKDYGEKI